MYIDSENGMLSLRQHRKERAVIFIFEYRASFQISLLSPLLSVHFAVLKSKCALLWTKYVKRVQGKLAPTLVRWTISWALLINRDSTQVYLKFLPYKF